MPDRDGRLKVLVLGGTAEANDLVRHADARFGDAIAIVASLAGRTGVPAKLPVETRQGGFGGVEGLTEFLRARDIDLLIDATHPFAAVISRHARAAADAAGVPRLLLLRPPWQRTDGDRWIEAADAAAAARAVGGLGRRIWLTFGGAEVAAFAALAEHWFLVRRIEPPREPLPLAHFMLVLGRGPFTPAGERALIERHAIDALVTKASGGEGGTAKLAAAREAGLPVVMIARPPAEPGEAVESVEAAMAWIAAHLQR